MGNSFFNFFFLKNTQIRGMTIHAISPPLLLHIYIQVICKIFIHFLFVFKFFINHTEGKVKGKRKQVGQYEKGTHTKTWNFAKCVQVYMYSTFFKINL